MIIYKATNTQNGKCYIGQTTGSLRKRMYDHLSSLKSHFQRALKDIGAEGDIGAERFEWEVLCECNTTQELDEMEYHYIKQYDTLYPNGYNMREGGDCGLTHKSTRDRISTKLKGNTNGKKKYLIIKPDSEYIIVENLKRYCKDTGLNYNTMLGVANGRDGHHHHKGYVCRKLDDVSNIDDEIHYHNNNVKRNTSGYILTSPSNEDIIVDDLKNFCKNTPDLVRYGFIRLLQGKTTRKDHYKGWKIRRIKE